MKNYSPYQFSFFRIILGSYLVIHFTQLFFYAPEIWSCEGILPDASINPTYGYFPNILNYIDTPIFIQLFLLLLLVCSVLFLFGTLRQIVALIIWYGWVCLFDRNNFISNPGLPFIGWILLCCAAIPSGEPLSLFTRKKDEWCFPKVLFIGAWAIMAVSYSISGFDKFNSPSWRDGTAIIHLLNNPLARGWGLRTFFLSLPNILLHCMTWAILIIEMAFLLLSIFNKTRKWIWILMTLTHFGILLIVDFADLTLGMLMIHWFTFDASWLKANKSDSKKLVFFDGVCGLCNSFIDFLFKEDKDDVLQFAPLQGETAKKYLQAIDAENLTTLVFYNNGKQYVKSDAVIEILKNIGGVWKLAAVFKIIPKTIRDYGYNFVSKNRIKWFGKHETCRMPSEAEKRKLLI